MTELEAIRRNCLVCAGGSRNEVKFCPHKACFLWQFRFGLEPTKADKKAHILADQKRVDEKKKRKRT